MREKRGIWPIALVAVLVAGLMVMVFLPQIPLIAPDNPVHSKGIVANNQSRLAYCEVTVLYLAEGKFYEKKAYQLGACIHDLNSKVKVTYNQQKPSEAVVQLPVSPIEIAVLVMAFLLVILLTARVLFQEKKRKNRQDGQDKD